MPKRIDCVVGARPNFMKIAPILRAFDAAGGFSVRLIHTGQHYDVKMNSVFFDELQIPEPDLNLEIGAGTQSEQTAKIMIGIEQAFLSDRPDLLVVVGDVNSTLAATLVATKLHIPVAHVEAGLRSFDRAMPEELNRLVVDRLSDLLLTTERAAKGQLVSEGVADSQIHFVGNVMIDTMFANVDRACDPKVAFANHGAAPDFLDLTDAKGFGFVTMHRPSNVDDPAQLGRLLDALGEISQTLPLVFAVHPRTRGRIESAGLGGVLDLPSVLLTPPVGYLETLGIMRNAAIVITDSGGLQEETTALGVPCLTVRDSTERPITITDGTNTLVGSDADALKAAFAAEIGGQSKQGRIPELWDGRAAERIVDVIGQYLTSAVPGRVAAE